MRFSRIRSTEDLQEPEGGNATVIPVPDELDDAMEEIMQDQAAATIGRVYEEKPLIDGMIRC